MKQILNGLKFIGYIYSHPFDGFWIIDREKKGNIPTAILLFFALVLTTVYRILGTGYIFETTSLTQFSPWALATVLAAIILLYCICNWALTTLIGGSADVRRIFMATMYAITPIIIFNVPVTILANILVLKEAEYITFLTALSFIWALFLLLVSNSVIHEFTMLKSIVTFVFTVAGMAVTVILGLFFFYIVQQFFVWATEILKELLLRI